MPPKDPLVLGFDTSSEFCSAAIIRGCFVVASNSENIGRGHAERLFPLIESLLSESRLDWKDFAAIGAGTGPGNFTGTRISVAAARGLAMSLGIPAVGVTRFEALGFGFPGTVLASVDAGRNQVYLKRSDASIPCVQKLNEIRFENFPATVIGCESKRIALSLGIDYQPPNFPTAVAVALVAAQRMNTCSQPPAPIYIERRPATRPHENQISEIA